MLKIKLVATLAVIAASAIASASAVAGADHHEFAKVQLQDFHIT